MTNILIGILSGMLLLTSLSLILLRRRRPRQPEVKVLMSIEEMRAVGELSVFKVVTKEIVTAVDHWAGEFGRKYLNWLTSTRKMAMVFEFDIDFRFDLRDPAFEIAEDGEGQYRLRMPPCRYDIHIRDINFYDEQRGRLLPWLLPDLVNRVFDSGFDETDRNRLKEEAREQAMALAERLVDRLRGEVQASARETMEAIARGFHVQHVEVEFVDSAPQQALVQYEANSEG